MLRRCTVMIYYNECNSGIEDGRCAEKLYKEGVYHYISGIEVVCWPMAFK